MIIINIINIVAAVAATTIIIIIVVVVVVVIVILVQAVPSNKHDAAGIQTTRQQIEVGTFRGEQQRTTSIASATPKAVP